MSQPILSICIPTYNRCEQLAQLLQCLCPVKENLSGLIEICISDNSSSDQTPAIIDCYRSRLDLITNRNNLNLGFSGNMHKLLAMSSGSWCLFLGDDDLVDIPNVSKLVYFLHETERDTWIYMPVRNSWLTCLKAGALPGWSNYLLMLRFGISQYGFIGCNLIPGIFKDSYLLLPLTISRHWIHVNWWIMHSLSLRPFWVFPHPVVHPQDNYHATPYSRCLWQELWLSRLFNLAAVVSKCRLSRSLFAIVCFRETLSFSALKEIVYFSIPYPRSAFKRIKITMARVSCARSRPLNYYLRLIYLLSFAAAAMFKLNSTRQ